MPRKKVLFIAPQNTKGGIGSVLQLYSSSIENIEILYTYPEAKTIPRFFYFGKSIFKLVYKLSTDREISIVHIHTASRGSFYRKSIVLILSNLFAKKTILHIHGGGFKKFYESSYVNRLWVSIILQSADINICLSQEWFTFFKEQCHHKNFAVLPNPILMPLYQEPNKYHNKIVILYLGAVVQTKGIFDLVEFFSVYRPFLESKIDLHVGGEGDLNRLQFMVDKYKMNNHIKIHGWINREEKEHLFRKADLFILPSYAEGLPMSILEAMSYGKPIIATNVGGIPSLVKNQTNGWLFDPTDFHQLSKIFDELFEKPQLLLDYSKRSYQLAETYDIIKIKHQLEGLYENISSN